MGWEAVIYLIIATVISIALAPKPPKPKAAALEDFDLPTAEEGRPIPVVFGKCRITGSNILWYGDLGTKAIKKKSLFSSTTVGYKYYMGVHFGICHGPVDALLKVEAGEKTAWSGSIATNSSITISAPDLFGGKKREGGLAGTLDVCMGGTTQTANTYLDSAIGYPLGGPAVLGDLPAFRGILGLVWRGDGSGGLFSFLRYDKGGYIGTTPYPKPWAFTVKRITSGWHNGTVWYSAKAAIGDAMNAAHIVYQTLTDPEWGMGLPADKLDDASFTAAADLLHAEGFGLSLLWNQQATVEDFLSEVLNHVAGVLAFDRSTGKYRLTLVRGNYDPNTLTAYGPETLSAVTSFQRQAWGETSNELTLSYTDPSNLKATSVTVHDLANVRAQGVRVATGLSYPGIVSNTIAQEVAMRELAARSTPLAKITFRVNRDLWATRNSDVVKISWPALGIENLIVRVLKIRQGTLGNGEIEIEGVEDVFALALTTYTSQPAAPADETDPGLDEVEEAAGPSVISATTTAPPGSPADGDSYLVPTGATGAWAGHEGEVATWDADADAWIFETPAAGTVVNVTSTSTQVSTVTGGTAVSYTPIQTSGKVVFGTSITPPAIAADTNDYAPTGLATASGMRLSASGAARNITGLTGGEGGRIMLVHNVGTLDLILKDEAAGSTAANRFALNADVTLKADQSTLLQYDGTSSRWRVIGGTGSGGGSASPTTTKGDLIVRGALADERLPVGAPGQFLIPDPTASAGLKWGGQTPPTGAPNDGAAITRATDQAIPGATFTSLAFTAVERDDAGYSNLGTNNDRFTVTKSGWYAIAFFVHWDTASWNRGLWITKNGSAAANTNVLAGEYDDARAGARQTVSTVAYLAAGDYVRFEVFTDGASSILGTASPARASIHRLGTNVDLGKAGGASVKFDANKTVGAAYAAWVWDSAEWDSDGFWNASQPDRLTIPAGHDGRYLVVAGFSPTSASSTDIVIRKNGVTVAVNSYGSYNWTQSYLPRILDLVAGDYITVGGANAVQLSAATTRLQITRLGQGPRRIIRGAQFVAANGLLSTAVNPVAVHFPRAATIKGVRVLGGENAGSMVVDIAKTAFASWGSGPGSSICASAKPTLVGARTYADDALTGWTTAVAADDVLTFTLQSVSNLDNLSVQLLLDESQA
jgi:hypothetical protein